MAPSHLHLSWEKWTLQSPQVVTDKRASISTDKIFPQVFHPLHEIFLHRCLKEMEVNRLDTIKPRTQSQAWAPGLVDETREVTSPKTWTLALFPLTYEMTGTVRSITTHLNIGKHPVSICSCLPGSHLLSSICCNRSSFSGGSSVAMCSSHMFRNSLEG